ncbi:hypothetical protein [Demequina subtropica]|uniref:hypothetical protein n=1 Tax=Demequina subtropica TaxID=1638989 RepID=UPI00078435EC|nr:hypothetical protein [Demequina subtropica]
MGAGRSDGGISRRGALIGAAWTAPAILIAASSPAAASSPENPLDGSFIENLESGNDDLYRVTVHLPEGVVLENATLTIHWEPTNAPDASVEVSTGGSAWSPGATGDSDVVFVAPGPISDSDQFLVAFNKGQNRSPFTATLSGTVGDQDASVTFTGEL